MTIEVTLIVQKYHCTLAILYWFVNYACATVNEENQFGSRTGERSSQKEPLRIPLYSGSFSGPSQRHQDDAISNISGKIIAIACLISLIKLAQKSREQNH